MNAMRILRTYKPYGVMVGRLEIQFPVVLLKFRWFSFNVDKWTGVTIIQVIVGGVLLHLAIHG